MRRNFNERKVEILLIFLIIALTVTTVICDEMSMEKMYEEACGLLYTRHFEEAWTMFKSLNGYGDSDAKAEFCISYPKSETDYSGTLLSEEAAARGRTYPGGILYSFKDAMHVAHGLMYVPDEVNADTAWQIYYCGGCGEDYICYSELYEYFNNYHPNAVIYFCNCSGYCRFDRTNERSYRYLMQAAAELGLTVHDITTVGSSLGAYTALYAVRYLYENYGQKVTDVATLDAGLEWWDSQIPQDDDAEIISELHTTVWCFEQPTASADKCNGLRILIDNDVNIRFVACRHPAHEDISRNAYKYGVFSFIAGDEDIGLSPVEYSTISVTANTLAADYVFSWLSPAIA